MDVNGKDMYGCREKWTILISVYMVIMITWCAWLSIKNVLYDVKVENG